MGRQVESKTAEAIRTKALFQNNRTGYTGSSSVEQELWKKAKNRHYQERFSKNSALLGNWPMLTMTVMKIWQKSCSLCPDKAHCWLGDAAQVSKVTSSQGTPPMVLSTYRISPALHLGVKQKHKKPCQTTAHDILSCCHLFVGALHASIKQNFAMPGWKLMLWTVIS